MRKADSQATVSAAGDGLWSNGSAVPAPLPRLAPRGVVVRGPTPSHLAALEEAEEEWEERVASGWYARWGKPLGTLVLLLVTLPPALVLSVPIVLTNWTLFGDPRRILFSQERVGWRGRIFHIYKFRTMREAPGSDFQSWQGGDRLRVTRFGRILRRTHLDELPQLLNILRGEMTFIGPRPEMVEVERWASDVVPGFSRRLVIRPGITGHAQVTQGHTYMSPEDYRAKLEANDFYLRHLSLWFDLAILARTALCMLPIPALRRSRLLRRRQARRRIAIETDRVLQPPPHPTTAGNLHC